MAHSNTATDKIHVPIGALERPGKAKDGANCSETERVDLFEIDGHGFGAGSKLTFDSGCEVGAISRLHPALGPGGQALTFFEKFDLQSRAPPNSTCRQTPRESRA